MFCDQKKEKRVLDEFLFKILLPFHINVVPLQSQLNGSTVLDKQRRVSETTKRRNYKEIQQKNNLNKTRN